MSNVELMHFRVTYDAERGYVASHPDWPAPIAALSLSALRKNVEAELLFRGGRGREVKFTLDRAASRARDERRSRAQLSGARGMGRGLGGNRRRAGWGLGSNRHRRFLSAHAPGPAP
jgi:hypothetical protein